MVTVANAYATGQKVMGRANLRLGKLLPGSPEDLRFRAFFGVSAQVSVTAWDMMENHSVLPPTPEFLHFLWALAFMRTYPANDTTLSSLLGGRDPKTMSKYMWPFIRSIFALNEWLIQFENRKKGDVGNDCLLSVDGTDFRIAMGYSKPFGATSSRRVVFVMRWGCAS